VLCLWYMCWLGEGGEQVYQHKLATTTLPHVSSFLQILWWPWNMCEDVNGRILEMRQQEHGEVSLWRTWEERKQDCEEIPCRVKPWKEIGKKDISKIYSMVCFLTSRNCLKRFASWNDWFWVEFVLLLGISAIELGCKGCMQVYNLEWMGLGSLCIF
jgi:hypothetical protein